MAEGNVFACHSTEAWRSKLQEAIDTRRLDVAQEWDVEAMPTFIFIRDGRAVDKVVGAKKDDLERKVAALAAATAEAALVAQA